VVVVRLRTIVIVSTVVLIAASSSAAAVIVKPTLPPSPATWPPYPHFPAHSCWARPSPGGGTGLLRAAPSYRETGSVRLRPAAVADRLLARLGDQRYLHRIELGPPPPLVLGHLKGWFAGARPPANALWAYIAAPAAVATLPTHPNASTVQAEAIAEWETELVEGGLRDALCAAGGAPLVGWTTSGTTQGVSDHSFPFGQRFPNPTAAAFRARVRKVGKKYGFRVASLRLLHPDELAPLLTITTTRNRKRFAHDLPAIMRLLDPTRSAGTTTATTFEGFYLEAEDRTGPFASIDNAYRGEIMGGEWAANPCLYPYPHSEPATLTHTPPCS